MPPCARRARSRIETRSGQAARTGQKPRRPRRRSPAWPRGNRHLGKDKARRDAVRAAPQLLQEALAARPAKNADAAAWGMRPGPTGTGCSCSPMYRAAGDILRQSGGMGGERAESKVTGRPPTAVQRFSHSPRRARPARNHAAHQSGQRTPQQQQPALAPHGPAWQRPPDRRRRISPGRARFRQPRPLPPGSPGGARPAPAFGPRP